jgi:hypothetical protein
MKKTEEMFNFTLLDKSFTEQKMEGKRETKVVVQPKGLLKSYMYSFFSTKQNKTKQNCLSSWTTDLKHLKSISIHFKRFLSLSLLPSSPVSDLAWPFCLP